MNKTPIQHPEYHLLSWYDFFREYSQEPVNNIYVKSFDSDFPLKSVVKTFLSDFLLYQAFSYVHMNCREDFKVYLPIEVEVTGENERSGTKYKSLHCKKMNPGKVTEEISEWFTVQEADKEKKIRNIVDKIQDEILNKDYLFRENGFYKLCGNDENFDENNYCTSGNYEANDGDDHSSGERTDSFDYKIKFKVGEENLTPFQIIDSLFAIAIFTKRNKLADDFKQRQSLKSALAAVMARNQSHNIGSHVLSRFSDKNAIANCLKKYDDAQFIDTLFIEANTLKKLKNSKNDKLGDPLQQLYKDNKSKFINDFKTKSKVEAIAHHIATFNNYSKERQELLAEITSTVPQLQTNKKLKGEVLKNFTDNIILLDRISGIDNFKFTFQFDIQIPGHDEDDVTVGIANDVLGQQALYIILENLIRNTAKHATKLALEGTLPEPLVIFTIRIRESQLDSKFYQITIFDNVVAKTDLGAITIEDDDFNKHYRDYTECKECPEECNNERRKEKACKINPLTKLIIDQNALINKPILDDQNELRTQGLGLIEMEACAAYLRKLPVEKIDDEDFKLKFRKKNRDGIKEEIKLGTKDPRILRAVNPYTNDALEKLEKCKKDCDDKKQEIKDNPNSREKVLGYRFYLPKPQELLIIDNTEDNIWSKNISDDTLKLAQREGILILGTKNDDKNYKFDSDTIYPHEQMLVIGSLPDGLKHHYLPKRKLIIIKDNGDTFKKLKQIMNLNSLKKRF